MRTTDQQQSETEKHLKPSPRLSESRSAAYLRRSPAARSSCQLCAAPHGQECTLNWKESVTLRSAQSWIISKQERWLVTHTFAEEPQENNRPPYWSRGVNKEYRSELHNTVSKPVETNLPIITHSAPPPPPPPPPPPLSTSGRNKAGLRFPLRLVTHRDLHLRRSSEALRVPSASAQSFEAEVQSFRLLLRSRAAAPRVSRLASDGEEECSGMFGEAGRSLAPSLSLRRGTDDNIQHLAGLRRHRRNSTGNVLIGTG
ncbi:hypothetical protein AOLI_G00322350 [Acnodon oligacanthus]